LCVSAAVIVGIGFSGLAICLMVVCCGVVCLYRSGLRFNPSSTTLANEQRL